MRPSLIPPLLLACVVFFPLGFVRGQGSTSELQEGMEIRKESCAGICPINCTWPLENKDLVGITLYDANDSNETYLIASFDSPVCKAVTQKIDGSCYVNSTSHATTVRAVVAAAEYPGQTRTFICNATYYKDKFSFRLQQITVTFSDFKQQSVSEKDVVPSWVLSVTVVVMLIVLAGIIAIIVIFRRGILKYPCRLWDHNRTEASGNGCSQQYSDSERSPLNHEQPQTQTSSSLPRDLEAQQYQGNSETESSGTDVTDEPEPEDNQRPNKRESLRRSQDQTIRHSSASNSCDGSGGESLLRMQKHPVPVTDPD